MVYTVYTVTTGFRHTTTAPLRGVAYPLWRKRLLSGVIQQHPLMIVHKRKIPQ